MTTLTAPQSRSRAFEHEQNECWQSSHMLWVRFRNLCCSSTIELLVLMMPCRPTLMGSSTGPDIADAGWQVRVIDTILQNTYQIFDED